MKNIRTLQFSLKFHDFIAHGLREREREKKEAKFSLTNIPQKKKKKTNNDDL